MYKSMANTCSTQSIAACTATSARPGGAQPCDRTIRRSYLVDAAFNYPTFAEAYKVAALDVTNKMHTLSRFRG
jgi:hypothetical protein